MESNEKRRGSSSKNRTNIFGASAEKKRNDLSDIGSIKSLNSRMSKLSKFSQGMRRIVTVDKELMEKVKPVLVSNFKEQTL